jgi:hypothetical protein
MRHANNVSGPHPPQTYGQVRIHRDATERPCPARCSVRRIRASSALGGALRDVLELTQGRCRRKTLQRRFVAADILRDDLESLFRGADAVVHLAWFFQPTHQPTITWRNNVVGSVRVFDAFARAGVRTLCTRRRSVPLRPGRRCRSTGRGRRTASPLRGTAGREGLRRADARRFRGSPRVDHGRSLFDQPSASSGRRHRSNPVPAVVSQAETSGKRTESASAKNKKQYEGLKDNGIRDNKQRRSRIRPTP